MKVFFILVVIANMFYSCASTQKTSLKGGASTAGGGPSLPIVECSSMEHLPYYNLAIFSGDGPQGHFRVPIQMSTDVPGNTFSMDQQGLGKEDQAGVVVEFVDSSSLQRNGAFVRALREPTAANPSILSLLDDKKILLSCRFTNQVYTPPVDEDGAVCVDAAVAGMCAPGYVNSTEGCPEGQNRCVLKTP